MYKKVTGQFKIILEYKISEVHICSFLTTMNVKEIFKFLFFMGIKVMFSLTLKSHSEPLLSPIFPLQRCKSNFCLSHCSEKAAILC